MWLWCGVRCDWCRICAIWCDATCYVTQCQMRNVTRCGTMMWYVEYGGLLWRCEMCGIPSDVERFNAILDMAVWCGMMVEIQCGMCGGGIVWCEIYIWMWRCAWRGMWVWCATVCRDVVPWSDLMWMWCDVSVSVKCGAIKAINRNALKRDVAATVHTQLELTAQRLNDELHSAWQACPRCQPGATLCQASAPPGWAEVAQDWPHRW